MYRIPLGPFLLEEPVGKGGMGEVWRGFHRDQHTPVAIKVLTRDGVRNKAYLDSFGNEVQAVARLNHPGIVTVLDYGTVSAQAELASHHRMVEGSPYLVMEYARYGSLFEYRESLRWEELRAVLFTVLDALAHAHARGVIHRDLKPQNILLGCGEHDDVTLADFGLAHALHEDFDDEQREDAGWGTPHYMAPEQFRGKWRLYGPWTDLYALGCMAYELAAGQPVFDGGSAWDLGRAHIMSPVPRFFSKFEVPEGFESWLLRLLQKEPHDRFERAADAALALWKVGELRPSRAQAPRVLFTGRFGKVDQEATVWGDEEVEGKAVEVAQEATELLPGQRHKHTSLTGRLPSLDWASYATTGQDEIDTQPNAQPEPAALTLPTIPETWRQANAAPISMQLLGAGLGLFGLRQLELVGREAERDALWSRFRALQAEPVPAAVLLRGDAGVGKSKLAQWFVERAHELGLATPLKANYSPVRGPFDGLSPMFARHLRVAGLAQEDALKHLERWAARFDDEVDAYEVEALAHLILAPEQTSQAQRSQVLSQAQRFALFRRLLGRIAQGRPLILWLDDIQWGAEGLFFARYLLQQTKPQDDPLPLLLVMTMRDEGLVQGSLEQMLLEELEPSPRFEALALTPLPKDQLDVLIQQLLGLEPNLAAQVSARAQGVPLFAVQLVEDWVAGGKLEVGRYGFMLKPGQEAQLPEDIDALWRGRLARIFSGLGPTAPMMTMLGAALGQEISWREWAVACRYLGFELDEAVPVALSNAGLLVALPAGEGWRVCHGMLRESLERMALKLECWGSINVAIARMLKALYHQPDEEIYERMARHWIEANALELAIHPMLQAIKLYMEQSQLTLASSLLDELEGLLNLAEMPESDERRGRVWTMRSRVLDQQGRYLDALRWASTAIEYAQRYKWIEVMLEATVCRAYAAMHRGSTEEAEVLLKQALVRAPQLSHERLLSLIGLGRCAQRRGQLEQARAYFEQGLGAAEQCDDLTAQSTCLNGLGDIARQAGDYEAALDYAQLALVGAESLKNAVLIADCHNDLAELHRLQGDYPRAATRCLKAISIYESVQSEQSLRARMNYAFILLGQRSFEEATEQLRALFDHFRLNHDYGQLALASVGVLPCLASLGQWPKLMSSVEMARRLLAQTGRRDLDVVFACELAYELAMEARQHDAAQALERLAQDYGPLI